MKLPRTTWVPGEGPRPDDAWIREVDHDLLFSVGVMLFERGQGFEAHEVWELAWKDAKLAGDLDDERLLKALIKLAAAMVKIRQKNPVGVHDHARGALALLNEIRAHELRGISIAALRAMAQRVDEAPPEARPVGEPMLGKIRTSTPPE